MLIIMILTYPLHIPTIQQPESGLKKHFQTHTHWFQSNSSVGGMDGICENSGGVIGYS